MTASIPTRDQVAPQNVTLDPRELHMEIFDPRTTDVWLHQRPVTQAQYDAFRPEAPLVKSGIGRSAMDFAWFLRSPGAAANGPLETRTIGGLECVRVARPVSFRGFAAGDAPTRMKIDKHHAIGFDAGSVVRLAQVPDGLFYVQQTVTAAQGVPVPADWRMHELRPRAPWTIYLGSPVTVHFFRNLSSFMGPLRREDLPDEPQTCAAPEPL
ncbi:MAG TPA: hypothetical protein VM074_13250 [Solimonas sp.]|nr:hypothetical protein [Solimonas sp.]